MVCGLDHDVQVFVVQCYSYTVVFQTHLVGAVLQARTAPTIFIT